MRSRETVPVEQTVRDVVGLLRALGVESPTIGGRRLVGLGVAIAGLVDDATNVVVRAPNLGWTDVGLGEALADQLGFELPVFVANDGDVGALAEVRFGAGVGIGEMLYVSGEVGVGGGLFVGGRRVAGRSGFAGEIGHMPINPDGRPCRCGSSGCWETETGELALLARGGRDSDAGIHALAEMIEAAERGEPAAVAAFADEARWLGLGIAGLINIFDPELVVLGGLLRTDPSADRRAVAARSRGSGVPRRSPDRSDRRQSPRCRWQVSSARLSSRSSRWSRTR